VKHVAEHIRVNASVKAQLEAELAQEPQHYRDKVRGMKLVLDPSVPDDQCVIVEEHDIKPNRLLRLGSEFYFRHTLYVNPHDPRLEP
jgi:hypothetical protein